MLWARGLFGGQGSTGIVGGGGASAARDDSTGVEKQLFLYMYALYLSLFTT
jgi:hypothetical protein